MLLERGDEGKVMVDIFALLDLKELNFEGVSLLSSRGEVGV